MTRHDRAAQLWPLLALAARNRQILTYDMVSRLTGVPRPAVGGFLAPIQDFCLRHKLPPLTILVVSEETGLPGAGLPLPLRTCPKLRWKFLLFDWLGHAAPSPEAFELSFGEAKKQTPPAPQV